MIASSVMTLAFDASNTAESDAVSMETPFQIGFYIPAHAWALRSLADNALWWAMTLLINSKRPAKDAAPAELPDYMAEMLGGAESPRFIGVAAPAKRSSWQDWAAVHKAALKACQQACQQTDVPFAGDAERKGMVHYLATPASDALKRTAKAKAEMGAMKQDELNALVPERLRVLFTDGVQTRQAAVLAAMETLHTECAVEMAEHLRTCMPDTELQAADAIMLLERFSDALDTSMGRDLTSRRLMPDGKTLSDNALAEMVVYNDTIKQCELEIAAIRRDFLDGENQAE